MAKTETAAKQAEPHFITGFWVDSFMGIDHAALTLEPGGGMVKITGDNGEGKTSLITAILAALKWEQFKPKNPIKTGAQKATVKLEISKGKTVALLVELTITTAGTRTLKVMLPDGTQLQAGQTVLDLILGQMVDPGRFLQLKPADQREYLLDVSGKRAELEALKAKEKEAYSERTTQNSIVKRMESQLGVQPTADNTKTVDVVKLKAEHDKASKAQAEIAGLERDGEEAENSVTFWAGEAKRLEKELKDAKENAAAWQVKAEQVKGWIEDARAKATYRDPAVIMREIVNASEINAKAEKAARWESDFKALRAEREKAAALDKAVDDARAAQVELIKAAKLPLDGLDFTDNGVTFNGHPFEDCSTSERMDVSLALAMAASPDMRFIVIRDGSMFDPKAIERIDAKGREMGYQLLTELVGADGKRGIQVEDGKIKTVDGKAQKV